MLEKRDEPHGVISLINHFSISCIFDAGSRVSLSHLIEFSSFVDLYVLEEKIYITSIQNKFAFHHLDSDKNSPFIQLTSNQTHDYVDEISNLTTNLYNSAKIKFTFSIDSYDYWLKLSKPDKYAIPKDYGDIEPLSRTFLLMESRCLENEIQGVIEHLAETKHTLMPSPQNIIPFLSAFDQINTPAMFLYEQIARQHKLNIDEVLSLIRPKTLYLPPLLSILLSRCETREDIPSRLIELRAEYEELRDNIKEWTVRLDNAKSLKDKIEIRDELNSAVEYLIKGVDNKRGAVYQEAIGSMVEAIDDGDAIKLLTKPALKLIKAGVTELIPEKFTTRRYTGLMNLFEDAVRIEDYSSMLRRVFKEDLDITQVEIMDAKKYRAKIISSFGVQLTSPS